MTRSARLTVACAFASFLAVLPLLPLTETDSWLVPAAVVIALVAFTGAAMRRSRAPRGLVPLAQLGVATLWLGLLVAADVAWMAVVPTPSWFERMGTVIGEGVDSMFRYAAPVPVERGMQFMIVAGTALVAVSVEIAVFVLRRVPLAGIPLAVMYAVAATTAREGWHWVWFVPPAVGFLWLLVAEGRNRVTLWGRSASPSARHPGLPQTDSLARSGRRAGAVALAAAIAVPAWVPALTEGFIGSGGGGGDGGRTIRTDNPIVDLRRDLLRNDNVDILEYTTTADRPDYIRTATLDLFTGEEWKLSQRDVPESQRVDQGMPRPPGLSSDADVTEVTYEFEITDNFRSRWLPLAYPAQAIDIDGDWRYDTTTLDVVADEDEDVKGKSYEVTSLVLNLRAEDLRASAPVIEEMQDMVALPEGMREALEPFVDEAIGDITNRHEQAAALQAWFRSQGDFTYSLERDPGTSASHLLDFLTNRVGYCEQFAASMAIMARAIGIPARVAVGFTPGERQDDGRWIVRAHDSHAWPELFFDGIGWVRFEPTPSTRTNAAPAWTLPARDDDEDGGGSQGGSTNADSAENQLGPEGAGNLAADEFGGPGGGIDQGLPWLTIILVAALVLVVLTAPQAIARIIRARRWRQAEGDPVGEAEAAWTDFRDAVRDAGLRWNAAATPRGVRRLVLSQVKLDAAADDRVRHLVRTIERARYAATTSSVPGLREHTQRLRSEILNTRSRRRRLAAWLWPAVVHDLLLAGTTAAAEGLTWLDSAGERLRARVAPASRR